MTAEQAVCEHCGGSFPVPSRGRPKRVCSDGCRKALQRRAKSEGKASRLPARGYSWPPFAPGHKLSVRHGASSAALVAERTAEVRSEFLERWPFLTDKDSILLDTFLTSVARLRMMDEYWTAVAAGEREAFPAKGRPRSGPEAVPTSAHDQMTRLAAVISRQAHELGLGPLAFAQLSKDSAVHAALVRDEKVRGLMQVGYDILRARGEVIDVEESGE